LALAEQVSGFMPLAKIQSFELNSIFPATGHMHVSKLKMPAGKGPGPTLYGFLNKIYASILFFSPLPFLTPDTRNRIGGTKTV
jgi:hypothetical protein